VQIHGVVILFLPATDRGPAVVDEQGQLAGEFAREVVLDCHDVFHGVAQDFQRLEPEFLAARPKDIGDRHHRHHRRDSFVVFDKRLRRARPRPVGRQHHQDVRPRLLGKFGKFDRLRGIVVAIGCNDQRAARRVFDGKLGDVGDFLFRQRDKVAVAHGEHQGLGARSQVEIDQPRRLS